MTKEVWDIVQEGYGNSGMGKKIMLKYLQRHYELLSMVEQETVVEYVGRIQVVANAMRACDKIIKDQKNVEKILRTLTPQYDHIVVAIEESHEQRLIERKIVGKGVIQGTNQDLQAINNQSFKGHGAGRGRGRSRGGGTGGNNVKPSEQTAKDNGSEQKEGNKRGGRQFRGRGRKGYDKRNVQCYTCNKYVYYSAECWPNESTKKNKNDEAANLAQDTCDSESDHVLLMSNVEEAEDDLCWRLMRDRCVKEQDRLRDRCTQDVSHALDRCNCEDDHMLLSK
ncbi:uncharacterized protein LOC124830944 [Vigna umbellata]|uniref:uncharacterized protein LOC124830944 n=1 Tax=Vigna umbellata TaxID=87088 RepID=UPI001F5E972F|nr:uncharacterized protein LOC124830944 [Vigna umbellata]